MAKGSWEFGAFIIGAALGVGGLWLYNEYLAPAVIARTRLARRPQRRLPAPQPYGIRPGLSTRVKYAPEMRVVTAPKFIPGVLRPKFMHGA